jgi:hypothetical protein
MRAACLTEPLRFGKLAPRFLVQSLSVQHFREFAVHLRGVWPEACRFAEMLGGASQISAAGQNYRQVIVGFERIGSARKAPV